MALTFVIRNSIRVASVALAAIVVLPAFALAAPLPKLERSAFWRVVGYNREPRVEESVFLQRYLLIMDVAAPISSLQQSTVARRGPALKNFDAGLDEARKWAEAVRAAADAPKWTEVIDKASGLILFRADWKKQNRFVQLAYRDLGETYVFSTSTTRRLYVFEAGAEANAIQQYMAKRVPREKDPSSAAMTPILDLIRGLVLPEAEAQVPGLGNITPLTLGLGNLGAISPTINLNDLNALFNQLNTGLGQLGATGNAQAAQLLAQGRTTLAGIQDDAYSRANGFVNTTLSSARAQYTGALADTVTAGRQTIDYARDQALSVERQAMSDVNNLIRRTTSTGNLVRMGAATAAGAAFGGMAAQAAVTLAIDGTSAVVSGLYHAIMGTLTSEQRARMSAQAQAGMQELDAAWQQLAGLEGEIDKRIGALATVAGIPPDQLAMGLSAVNAHNERELARAWAEYQRASGPEEQRCQVRMAQAQTMRERLQGLAQVLSADSLVSGGTCGRILQLLRQWRNAEYAMYHARMAIANNSAGILSDLVGRMVSVNTDRVSDRRAENTCLQNQNALDRFRRNTDGAQSQTCVNNALQGQINPTSQARQEAERQCALYYQREMARARDLVAQTCADNRSMQEGRNPAEELRMGMSLASRAVVDAQTSIREITNADCQPGDPSERCGGRVGAFTVIQAKYRRLVGVARQACPGLPLDPVAESAYAPLTPPGQAPDPMTPLAGQAPPGEGPGMFRRSVNYVGDTVSGGWRWATGWLFN